MKLSLNQTKELLERVEKQLLEKKINLQEDTPRDPFGGKNVNFDGLVAAGKKEKPAKMREELIARAKSIVNEPDPEKQLPMSGKVRAVMEKIAAGEEVTKEEIKNVLSGMKFGTIMQLLQSYLKGVLGSSL